MATPIRLTPPASLRRSPFFEATERLGCRDYSVTSYTMSDVSCYPGHILDPIEEYWKLVRDVVVFDVPVERPIEIQGPEASHFVERLLTRDLSGCAVGQCRYVIMVDNRGGTLFDSILLRLADQRFWLSGDLGWVKGLAVGFGVDVSVTQADAAPIQVQGPKSRAVMDRLFGEAVSGLPFYHLAEVDFRGTPLVVSRTGWTGEVGYEVYLRDASMGIELWDAIMEAGTVHGIAATGTSNIRRVEAGILDSEIRPDMTPYELGLGRLVQLDKPTPFVGQSALRRLHAEGPARRLVGYAAEAEVQDTSGYPWPVAVGGAPAGNATVAVRSPNLERTIGYAILAIRYAEPGTRLVITASSGPFEAVVVPMPFVDSERKRLRG